MRIDSIQNSRLFLTAVGNLYGFLASVLVQFLTTPVLIHFWGLHIYGDWVFYYTLPGFASLYGASVIAVGENEAVMAADALNEGRAKAAIAKTCVVACSAALFAGLLLITIMFSTDLTANAKFNMQIGVLTITSGMTSLASYTLQPVFRVSNHLGVCLLLFNTQRLLEAGAIVSIAAMHFGIEVCAWAVLSSRIIFFFTLCAVILAFRRYRRWIPGLNDLLSDEIRIIHLAKSSLHSSAGAVANLLRQSLPLVIVHASLGATATAEFSLARMFSRIPGFIFLIINNSLRSELTHLYGKNGKTDFVRFSNYGLIAIACIGLFALTLTQFTSEIMITWWLRGKVTLEHSLVMLCVGQCISDALVTASFNPYFAVNHHRGLSWWLLLSTIIAMAISWLAVVFTGPGMLLATLVAADLYLLALAVFRSQKQGYALLRFKL